MARKKKAPAKKTASKKLRTKSPPCPMHEEWTEAQFFSFLRSALRSASNRWPPKYQCLANATRPYKGPDKRRKKERHCAHCLKWFPTTQTQADHIIPAGTLRSWDDLVPFVMRLFVPILGFQCLCTTCHNAKTQLERKQAKENKNNE